MTPADRPPMDAATARAGPELAVVVPVVERPEPLGEVYEANRGVLESTGLRFEVLFVVQPHARRHADSLWRPIADDQPIRVLQLGQMATESEMLAAAVASTRAPVILTLPPYPRVDPSALPALVEAVRGGADMAVAARVGAGDSGINALQRRLFNALLRSAVGGDLRDVASGVRAMHREVLDHVPLYGDFFRFLPVLAARDGFRVVEIEAAQHPGDRGRRLFGPGVYVRRLLDLFGLTFLARFTTKPLRFFGLVGAYFSGVGGVMLVVLAGQRLTGTPLADRPVLILAVVLFVLGIQAVALGLVGEIVVHFHQSEHRSYRLARDMTRGLGDPESVRPDSGVRQAPVEGDEPEVGG